MIASISDRVTQYMRDGVSGVNYVDTVHHPDNNEDGVLIRESGGTARRYPDDRHDITIQFISRSPVFITAQQQAYDTYNHLRSSEHNLTLPAAVGKTGSTTIFVTRIDVIQPPFSLGFLDNYFQFSFNAVITYFI